MIHKPSTLQQLYAMKLVAHKRDEKGSVVDWVLQIQEHCAPGQQAKEGWDRVAKNLREGNSLFPSIAAANIFDPSISGLFLLGDRLGVEFEKLVDTAIEFVKAS